MKRDKKGKKKRKEKEEKEGNKGKRKKGRKKRERGEETFKIGGRGSVLDTARGEAGGRRPSGGRKKNYGL